MQVDGIGAGTASATSTQSSGDLSSRIDAFVERTRVAIYVRAIDQVLMIRPDKVVGINTSAVQILQTLYQKGGEQTPSARLLRLTPQMNVTPARLLDDAWSLLQGIQALFAEDYSPRPGLRFTTFDRGRIAYPTLAEIALTYRCQNRCRFCYAASPSRGERQPPMTVPQIVTVMRKIFDQAHVPSLSFTGGEATLRRELPELIDEAKRIGFRVNLISNGVRLADKKYADALVEAGLDSVQISLEAGEAELHDSISGRDGAFARTVQAVANMRERGIHVHTNTTLCADNLEAAPALLRFVRQDLGLETCSMNMVIRTGDAGDGRAIGVTYSQVARALPDMVEQARAIDLRLVWYSPIPYCLFNPVEHGLGAKSCACVDGIVSINPAGQLLPCSSFEGGIGNLLDQDFDQIYRGRRARYWRDKKYIPPVCRDCDDVDICAGACPLYWDAAGSFAEIARADSPNPRAFARWRRGRDRSGAFGVNAGSEGAHG